MFLLLQSIDDGLLSLDSIEGGPPTPKESLKSRVAGSYYRKYIPGQQAKLIEMLNQMLQANEKIGPERRAILDQIQLPPRNYENLMVNLLVPACDKVLNADIRVRAQCATAAVAIACERYRKQFGNWPLTLQSIPKSILATIPIDPYTGDTIKYVIQNDGPVVYAVGLDLIDNSGENLDPKGDPGTDIGFKLLNTNQRRKPPLPKPAALDQFWDDENNANGIPIEPGTNPESPGIERKP